MEYKYNYDSKIGKILIRSDGKHITGLWFYNQKYFPKDFDKYIENDSLEVFNLATLWLNEYFEGKKPNIKLPIKFDGSDFQNIVWNILLEISYGKVITYKDISNIIAKKRNLKSMSSQAVGSAVGHNPISIIIPCHRVVGSNKNLTGFAGGIDKKIKLLELEGQKIENSYIK